jgi:hypothetical protein
MFTLPLVLLFPRFLELATGAVTATFGAIRFRSARKSVPIERRIRAEPPRISKPLYVP